MVLTGSHQLVRQFLLHAHPSDPGRSPAVRDRIFTAHPWLRDLHRPAENRITRLMHH